MTGSPSINTRNKPIPAVTLVKITPYYFKNLKTSLLLGQLKPSRDWRETTDLEDFALPSAETDGL